MAWIKTFEDPDTGEQLMTSCTLEETKFGAFLRNRTCAGQGIDNATARSIVEADARLFSDIDQMLVMTANKIDKGFPNPTSLPNPPTKTSERQWTAAIQKRWLVFEYIRFRINEMKELPHQKR